MTAIENTTVQAPPRTLSERLARFIGRTPVHLVLALIALIWLVPSIGLFVTSFRPSSDMRATGWWDIATWTNFFWPFIILDPGNPTLPVALQQLQAAYFVDYSLVLNGVVLMALPLIVLFVFAGRQLVSGIMQGAVKG